MQNAYRLSGDEANNFMQICERFDLVDLDRIVECEPMLTSATAEISARLRQWCEVSDGNIYLWEALALSGTEADLTSLFAGISEEELLAISTNKSRPEKHFEVDPSKLLSYGIPQGMLGMAIYGDNLPASKFITKLLVDALGRDEFLRLVSLGTHWEISAPMIAIVHARSDYLDWLVKEGYWVPESGAWFGVAEYNALSASVFSIQPELVAHWMNQGVLPNERYRPGQVTAFEAFQTIAKMIGISIDQLSTGLNSDTVQSAAYNWSGDSELANDIVVIFELLYVH